MNRLPIALVLALALSCGANKPSVAQVAGNWTGNLSSNNWNAAAVNANMSQADAAVSGTWWSDSFDWNGTISGTVSAANFTGTFTISAPNSTGVGVRCTGTASVSGTAGRTAISWSGAGFTGSCTGFPVGITFNMQRQ